MALEKVMSAHAVANGTTATIIVICLTEEVLGFHKHLRKVKISSNNNNKDRLEWLSRLKTSSSSPEWPEEQEVLVPVRALVVGREVLAVEEVVTLEELDVTLGTAGREDGRVRESIWLMTMESGRKEVVGGRKPTCVGVDDTVCSTDEISIGENTQGKSE